MICSILRSATLSVSGFHCFSRCLLPFDQGRGRRSPYFDGECFCGSVNNNFDRHLHPLKVCSFLIDLHDYLVMFKPVGPKA